MATIWPSIPHPAEPPSAKKDVRIGASRLPEMKQTASLEIEKNLTTEGKSSLQAMPVPNELKTGEPQQSMPVFLNALFSAVQKAQTNALAEGSQGKGILGLHTVTPPSEPLPEDVGLVTSVKENFDNNTPATELDKEPVRLGLREPPQRVEPGEPERTKAEKRDEKLGLTDTRKGGEIKERLVDGETEVGTNTITIIETKEAAEKSVQRRISVLKGKKEELERKEKRIENEREGLLRDLVLTKGEEMGALLKKMDKARKENEALTQQIMECDVRIEANEKIGRTLDRDSTVVHSTFSREVLRGAENLKNRAVGEPPNVMVKKLSTSGLTYSTVQFGALGDQRNTKVSLKLLGQVVKKNKQAEHELEKTKNELQACLDTNKHPKTKRPLTDNERAVITHMVDELSDPEKAFAEREEILQTQMLSVLNAHVQEACTKGPIGTSIQIAHTSLLHPKTEDWDSASGLPHNERNLIEDMEEIFSEFNGKKIVFGEKDSAVYLDENGIVHLPSPIPEMEGKEVTLQTHYTNIPVFGSVSEGDKELLDELNSKKLRSICDELEERITKISRLPKEQEKKKEVEKSKLKSAKQRLEQSMQEMERGNCSFDHASAVIEAQKLLGRLVSTGCFSNKDRGGHEGRKELLEEAIHEKEAEAGYYETLRKKEKSEETDNMVKTLRDEIKHLSRNVGKSVAWGSAEIRFALWTSQICQMTLKVWLSLKEYTGPVPFIDNVTRLAATRIAKH